MALYIKVKHVDGKQSTYTWHVGQPNPIEIWSVMQVIHVQADGDELEYITGYFNVPNCTHQRVVRWFGDHAKFIVANL